ncbi:hypothetical protein QC763_0048490 [Podospora pseudopauciseta]|uniref:Uncharacterized protein n=1 Tax=Podospora pseudopauciseta TaxID=2093780 RepID=A0ABR0HEW2_9PEZI|nr:hypothetical protein QC763_0048490 [Podospora pseudopauciseta]
MSAEEAVKQRPEGGAEGVRGWAVAAEDGGVVAAPWLKLVEEEEFEPVLDVGGGLDDGFGEGGAAFAEAGAGAGAGAWTGGAGILFGGAGHGG